MLDRECVHLGDGATIERHRECFAPQTGAPAVRARHAPNELHRSVSHLLAFGVGQDVHDVLARAPELPVVPIIGATGFRRDQDGRLFVRKQKPVAFLLLQFPPRLVDVDSQSADHTSQIGALPASGPRGDRPVSNAQG